MRIAPLTSRGKAGLAVPIPTFPLELTTRAFVAPTPTRNGADDAEDKSNVYWGFVTPIPTNNNAIYAPHIGKYFY